MGKFDSYYNTHWHGTGPSEGKGSLNDVVNIAVTFETLAADTGNCKNSRILQLFVQTPPQYDSPHTSVKYQFSFKVSHSFKVAAPEGFQKNIITNLNKYIKL